jgi:hypothetical protein
MSVGRMRCVGEHRVGAEERLRPAARLPTASLWSLRCKRRVASWR